MRKTTAERYIPLPPVNEREETVLLNPERQRGAR